MSDNKSNPYVEWWSTEVIGGNPALDWLSKFMTLIDGHMETGDGRIRYPQESVELAVPDMMEAIKETDGETQMIGWQVMAKILVDSGVYIGPGVGHRLLQAIKNDPWSEKSFDRKISMDRFLKLVNDNIDWPKKVRISESGDLDLD